MNLTAFLLYARTELRAIRHPYVAEKLEQIEDIDLCVWVVDAILREGKGRYHALAENFYQALGDYLTARRHEKASLRAGIEREALHFEGFLRTAVEAVFPEGDVELVDQGRSKGKLSQSGYVPDFLKHLLGMDANLGNSKPSYWKDRSVEEAVYGICFRHQQRAKHEARDYSLAELESLATQVLGAYVLFARWATRNSQIERQVRERRDFARNVAVLYWPEILQYQLTELRIGAEDQEMCRDLEKLRGHAAQLVQQAKELRERGTDPTSEEIREFYVTLEGFASDYEMLVSELNIREWGREQAADRWS